MLTLRRSPVKAGGYRRAAGIEGVKSAGCGTKQPVAGVS
jgi:hypothetical protein